MATIIGISCSLRNARFGAGSEKLIAEIKLIKDKEALKIYLEAQSKIRADDFFDAGRRDDLPFNQIYRNLQKAKGNRGLSNSEAALAAGLWGAWRCGVEIKHCGLASYFPMNGPAQNLDELRNIILQADGILISGPVYFGDRGSPAQEFIEFLREDKAISAHIRDRVYAGIATGAKRNGGQETQLIYQFIDMTNLNMLAVGNDSETTAQYGGTVHAGDVGMFAADDYGINTSIGTGRRIARVCQMVERSGTKVLTDKVRIAIWLLQDMPHNRGRALMEKFCREVEARDSRVEIKVHDFTDEHIYRCIACDLCPTDSSKPEVYRCIIKSSDDLFMRRHQEIIKADAVLLGAYSPVDRHNIRSVYQRFIERTRYIRRDDYRFGDRLSAPFVISEINSNQNLHIRMMTSAVRHHTVLHHPLIGMELDGQVVNWDALVDQGLSFARNAAKLTVGRLTASGEQVAERIYHPVGYVISGEKFRQDRLKERSNIVAVDRREEHEAAERRRLAQKT